MASELQRLVDSVGSRLGRSVAIDDAGIRLLAYNAHVREVDEVRTGSILRRGVPRAVVDHVRRHCGGAEGLFTVPADAVLGLRIDRIGMPVRHNEDLLGFLWLLASDGPVTAEDEAVLRRTAETAALIMHREYLIGELTRGRERELARDVVSGDEVLRDQAAGQLVEEGLFVVGPVAAMVVRLARTPVAEQDRLALAAGLELARHRSPQRHLVQLERPDHGILLLARPTGDDLRQLGTMIRDRVLREAVAPAACWVGIGGRRDDLSTVYQSYVEARAAADIARDVRVLGPVVCHSELGVYGMLAELPAERLAGSIPAGLRTLLTSHAAADDALITTIETFLDNAGHIKRTAEQLGLHRTSLYYRLQRVEQETGLDLRSGDDRLILHLGLKIARLIEPR
ncbi:PucR family transcriptional regulator [Actinocrispum wychmicini]|uniref:PucR-like helix-turn-helix protein n=1 Tax=Actinocrispum wychmicini TaxID=1213861 RepID=A0A4R2J5K1_9PSEU|nr:PucR family transcriptional regulator [Actinocrispum wychmicini]TCO54171.1 PucR-like helix-turn-helix protein [Actinocrispum wychmicini]